MVNDIKDEQNTDSSPPGNDNIAKIPKEKSEFLLTVIVGVVAGLLAAIITIIMLVRIAPNINVNIELAILGVVTALAANNAPNMLKGAPNEKAKMFATIIAVVLVIIYLTYTLVLM